MTAAIRVEPGDVVVRASSQEAGPAYVLRAVPGPDQVGCATLVEATRLARAYGQHAGVNAWVQNVDRSMPCLLIEHHRGSAGAGIRSGRSAGGRDNATTTAAAATVRHAASISLQSDAPHGSPAPARSGLLR